MWLFLLLGAFGVGVGVALSRSEGTADQRLIRRMQTIANNEQKTIAHMAAQLNAAHALWGVFERSKKVHVKPAEFDEWDLLRTATSQDDARAVAKQVLAEAQRERAGELEVRILGVDETGRLVSDFLSRRSPEGTPYET